MSASHTIELTDTETNLSSGDINLSPDSLAFATPTGWKLSKVTLRGGLQEGIDLVEIDNGSLQLAVLPTRGMSIWKARLGDLRLGWDSPVKDPVHPAYMNLQAVGGIGWLKGFNEWIVRCGLSSMGAPGEDVIIDNNGNPTTVSLPLHGNIANIPARKVSVQITDSEIILRGEVLESMMFGPNLLLTTELRTGFGSSGFTLTDTVTNIGRNPTDHQLLYHINCGSPLLEPGTRLVAPFREVAPRDDRALEGIEEFATCDSPQAGFVEQAYWMRLQGKQPTGNTAAMLKNAAGNKAAVLRYTLQDFPCFTFWKNTAAREDGYVTGMEPATAFPNNRANEREQGRVILLDGGESRQTRMTVDVLDSSAAVTATEAEIRDLARQDPTIHNQPRPEGLA